MGDDEPTRPLRLPPCPYCLRPVTAHDEHCIVANERTWHRTFEGRLYFDAMPKRVRILVLGVGAANRGTTFHYTGDFK